MTLSAKPSTKGPQERGALQDRRNCTPHNPPVIYAPDGYKMYAGPRMFMPGRQLYLYKRFPIRNFHNRGPTQTPPYGGRPRPSTVLKLITNMERNIEDAQEAAPILCQSTPPVIFTQTHQSSHPPSPWAESSCLPYRRAPKLPTQPKRSPRPPTPPPPTTPHRQPSGGENKL